MISISISGVDRVKKALENIKNINNLVAKWMKSGSPDEIMQKSFERNFTSQGRPSKWQALSEETKDERIEKGFGSGPILVRTGNLKDEVISLKGKVISSGSSTQISWGIDQLRESEKGKFKAHQTGKGYIGQNLPKREIIGFQKADGKKLVSDLRSWILKSL